MKQSKQYWKLSSTANCHKHIRMRIDYEQSLFFLSPSSETRETKMVTHVTAASFVVPKERLLAFYMCMVTVPLYVCFFFFFTKLI